jgi:Type I phosphodiesterase / nucleotide pyrophosphatase
LRDLGQVPRREDTRGHPRPTLGYLVFTIFLVVSAFGAGYAALSLHHRSNINAAAPFHPAMRAVIFVLGGYSGTQLLNPALPNLSALATQGVAYPNAWAGEFPTSPATLAASLGTGQFPSHDGMLGNEWADVRTHQVVNPVGLQQVLTGSIDQILEPTGTSSLASIVKAHRPNSKVVAVGGANCAAASAAASWDADYVVCAGRSGKYWKPVYVAGHSLPAGVLGREDRVRVPRGRGLALSLEGWSLGSQDDWVAREAAKVMRRVAPDVTYVLLPEPDLLSQYVPPDQRSGVMSRLLTGIDRDIGMVIGATRAMKSFSSTVFAVASTRGFEPIASKLPRRKFTDAIIGTGTQSMYLWADGAAMLGLTDASQAEAAAQVIQSERIRAIDGIYYKVRQTKTWSYKAQYINPDMPVNVAEVQSYLLNTEAAAGSAEVVAVYGPHTGTRGDILSGHARTATGMGLQWDNQHGFLLLSGHGANAGIRSSYAARMVDLTPTLAALLNLQTTSIDGNVLADAMFRPTPGSSARQAKQARRWTTFTRALADWENRPGF